MSVDEAAYPREMKRCSKCREVKPHDDFAREARSADGLRSQCRACRNAASRAWSEANKERKRAYNQAYYQANGEELRARNREYGKVWFAANRDEITEQRKEYREANHEKVKAQKLAWDAAHREQIREKHRERYAENREEILALHRKKYRQDPERKLKQGRAWEKANPERKREKAQRRRARKEANGVYYVSDRELTRLYASPCVACGSTDNINADHIIPIARGGHHSIGNLQALCGSCNSSKHDLLMIEWRARRDEAA